MADTVSTPFGDIPSFIFGGNTGVMSPKELEARRMQQIYRSARSQRAFPTTLGAGIASLGEAIGENMADRRLRAAEQAEMDRSGKALNDPRFLMPDTGPSAAINPRDQIAAAWAGPPPNPTVAAGDITSPQGLPQVAGGLPAEYAAAIAGIESAGGRDPYTVLGAVTPRGDRAFGKYQVMGANIPEWTQAALGQRLTPQQFLASKEVQDRVFQHRFGDYVNKYGPEGAARAWYAGEKGMNNLGATDQHGRLTVQGYGQDFMRRLPGTRTAAGPEGALPPDAGPAEGVGVDENPPTPTDIKPIMMAQAKPAVAAPVATDAPHVLQERPLRPIPPAPKPDNSLNPYEVRGHQLRALSRGNAEMDERAKTLIDYGAGVRKSEYDRKVEEWKSEVEATKQLRVEDAKFNATLPQLRQQYDEARVEAARKVAEEGRKAQTFKEEQTRKATWGDIPHYVEKDLLESRDKARAAAGSIGALRNATAVLDAGTVVGPGAAAKLIVLKGAAMAGHEPSARLVANTQTFQATLGPAVMAAVKAYGGPQVSNTDREYAAAMVGSDVSLSEEAIRRIIDIGQRSAKAALAEHKSKVSDVVGDNEKLHKYLGVPEAPEAIEINPATTKATTTAAPAAISDGATATGPKGEKMIRRGGRWEPM